MVVKWVLFLLICCLSDTSAVLFTYERPPRNGISIRPVEEVQHTELILVNGIIIIYKSSKRYYCTLFSGAENRQTLLHGEEGWTFPRQTVNLTLAYPSAVWKSDVVGDYVITGYQVIVFTDGTQGTAYINSGGLMEDNISLTFISNNITILSYRFWLYGAHRNHVPRKPNNLCY